MSKYAALIKAAKEDESVSEVKSAATVTPPPVQVSVKPENQTRARVKTGERASPLEEQVNLGVKVPSPGVATGPPSPKRRASP
jgi:hypothetical protein